MYAVSHAPSPYRNIKTVLSIGGGSYSHSGAFNFITDSSKRSTFVKSAVKLVEDYGLDGIDIDFEFPDTEQGGVHLPLSFSDFLRVD